MAPNPKKQKPAHTHLLSVSDIAEIFGVTRDAAKSWDWTGRLPAPDCATGMRAAVRGWKPATIWRDWAEPRGMTRAEFDAAVDALSGREAPQ